jgi:prepilin-type processing-associated H-X9-DG protein
MDIDFDLETPTIAVKPTRTRRRSPIRGWTLMKFILVPAFSLGLFAIVTRAVMSAREEARRSQCTCNLCQIKLALHNYHETYDTLPPAYIADANGKPVHSWRMLIMPFMEQSGIFNQYNFNEPWNGPNNIKLVDCMPSNLTCPSRSSSSPTLTSYVVVTGPKTMFPGATSVKFADVTDGLSNTLMVVEVANVNIPWTAPWDLDVRTMSFQINDRKRPAISSKHPGGANVVFGDASTRFLRESISPGNLRALITISGGEQITADQVFPQE